MQICIFKDKAIDMGVQTRWNLKVSQQLDTDLRIFLAERGGKKGDLSAFVEKAVAQALLRQTIEDVRNAMAPLSEEEALQLADREIAAFRRENPDFWKRENWAS
jgi:Ribbon-helix-helix domain